MGIHDIQWINNNNDIIKKKKEEPKRYFFKIRHGPTITKGTFYPDHNNNSSGKIILDVKDKGLAPGQFVVFYKMDVITTTDNNGNNVVEIDTGECLGAGVISENHWDMFL